MRITFTIITLTRKWEKWITFVPCRSTFCHLHESFFTVGCVNLSIIALRMVCRNCLLAVNSFACLFIYLFLRQAILPSFMSRNSPICDETQGLVSSGLFTARRTGLSRWFLQHFTTCMFVFSWLPFSVNEGLARFLLIHSKVNLIWNSHI